MFKLLMLGTAVGLAVGFFKLIKKDKGTNTGDVSSSNIQEQPTA